MRKEKKGSENYLERRPMRHERIKWSADGEGLVVLDLEHTGFFNLLAQKLFARPKTSHIHLDELGSFAWIQMDGEKDIAALGELVEGRFGDQARPLYERLAKYCQILDSCSFIRWK
ncbi:MAG: PqqD family peptide modification chaperone [Kineothrix sp.]